MRNISVKEEIILAELSPDLEKLIRYYKENGKYDILLTCGYRGKKLQDMYFANGSSKVKYGGSDHNFYPTYSVDILIILNGIMVEGKNAKEMSLYSAFRDELTEFSKVLSIPLQSIIKWDIGHIALSKEKYPRDKSKLREH